MSDQMRAEFEAAYLAKYNLKPQNWNGVTYLHAHGNGAWWAWQASRAALVVELPHIGDYLDTYRQGTNREEYLDVLCTAIQSAGVSVK